MAHTCPECGIICYCNGDIDDIKFDWKDDVIVCMHCENFEKDELDCEND